MENIFAVLATNVPAASEGGELALGASLPTWSVIPFALMLLAIAVLPLAAGHFWHSNRNRGLVSAVLGLPVAIWIWLLDWHVVMHTLHEYLAFIILLGALFVISGGIVIRGTLAGTPGLNAILLAIGAVTASFIGTTGASMLLIRPLLRANELRQRKVHVIVFFIFIVSNIGGLLTPLGDPPLFLGFLRGVPFLWTFHLWVEWAFLATILLVVFYIVDSTVFRKEDLERPGDLDEVSVKHQIPLSVAGKVNFLYLAGVVLIIFFSGYLHLPTGVQEGGMLAMAALSLITTARPLREENSFSWEPIVEVTVVFAGIFATMMPALAILNASGKELGLTEPWHFFWATGTLSSFLDNAPTYLTFASTASGLLGTDANNLRQLLAAPGGESLLTAISMGAVFMGANTYIGNGPNFMVKAVAEQAGVRMPSFFGYMLYSMGILIPLFITVTFVFLT